MILLVANHYFDRINEFDISLPRGYTFELGVE
mgnify:CR=1 FL=1